jgi:phage terminase small subunit
MPQHTQKPRRKVVNPKLSGMMKKWVLAYLADPKKNATEAARVAGYKDPEQSGWENRRNPKIQQYIREHYMDRHMTAEEVVARLSEIAEVGYAPYLRYEDGEVTVDLEQLLADGKGHLIKGISYTRTGRDTAVQVVEFYDAYKALVDTGRVHGIFKETSVNLEADVTSMSDEELDDLLERLGTG